MYKRFNENARICICKWKLLCACSSKLKLLENGLFADFIVVSNLHFNLNWEVFFYSVAVLTISAINNKNNIYIKCMINNFSHDNSAGNFRYLHVMKLASHHTWIQTQIDIHYLCPPWHVRCNIHVKIWAMKLVITCCTPTPHLQVIYRWEPLSQKPNEDAREPSCHWKMHDSQVWIH